jgi:hypothetical protein
MCSARLEGDRSGTRDDTSALMGCNSDPSRFQPLLVHFWRGNPGRAMVIGHMLSFNLGLPGSARFTATMECLVCKCCLNDSRRGRKAKSIVMLCQHSSRDRTLTVSSNIRRVERTIDSRVVEAEGPTNIRLNTGHLLDEG